MSIYENLALIDPDINNIKKAIARALLKNSKILLFDEITSALDEKTSYEIFQTLIKLKKTHTILMISHKPSEYQQCDQIINLSF